MNRLFLSYLLPSIAASCILCTALADPEVKEATITVQKDGSILFENQVFTAATLSKALTEAGFGAGSHVLMKSDPAASYWATEKIIDALRQPQRDITFEMEDDNKENPTAKASTKPSLLDLTRRAIKPFQKTAVGIKEQASLDAFHRYFTTTFGDAPILHLRNDTGKPVVAFTQFADTRSGKAVFHAEFVLLDKINIDSATPLLDWLQRNFEFPKEKTPPKLAYISQPDDEFDVIIDLTSLTDPKDPHSQRKPLPAGIYHCSLELYDAQETSESQKSGIPPIPLLSFEIYIK